MTFPVGFENPIRQTSVAPVVFAALKFGFISGSVVIRNSFNVFSVTRIEAGNYRVIFSNDAESSISYYSSIFANGELGISYASCSMATPVSKSELLIYVNRPSSPATLVDSEDINVVVFQ
jgi:hypothetical protein